MASVAGSGGGDEGMVTPGAPEELAGPPHEELSATRPVARGERISSMDVLRGFSLMGILVMNITDFAYGYRELRVSAEHGEAGVQWAALEDQY